MKKYIALGLAFTLLSCSFLFAAKITDESLLLGGSASVDQTITFKNGRKIKANQSTAKLQFSHDGSNFFDVGDVTGPAASTDNSVARFDQITGKLLDTSVVTISDLGVTDGITQLNVDNLRLDGNTISSTDTNGAVTVTPNGTGAINLRSVVVSSTSAVSGAAQLDVDNVRTDGNTVSATDTNGHLLLKANGTGKVKLGTAEMQFPNADGSTGQALITDGAGVLSFSTISGGSGGDVTDMVQNGQFETDANDWTASGSSTFTRTTTSSEVAFGTGAGKWDPTAASETLLGDAVAIPVGLKGKTCRAQMNYQWTGGTLGNIDFQVWDGSSSVVGADLAANTTSNKIRLFFTCPSSGNLQIRLIAAANEPAIIIDDVRLGAPDLTPQTRSGTAQMIGGGSCGWNASSGSWVDYTTTAACTDATVAGSAELPTTSKTPGFKVSNVQPGWYFVAFNANFYATDTSTTCLWTIYDGTTQVGSQTSVGYIVSGVFGIFTYFTPQTSLDFRIQSIRTAGAGSCRLEMGDGNHKLQMSFIPLQQ